MKNLTLLVLVAASCVMLVPQANAQDDHLKCYKVKDPLKLKGIVDLTTPLFAPEIGCKISKAKRFCVPAHKEVVSAFDQNGPGDLWRFWPPPVARRSPPRADAPTRMRRPAPVTPTPTRLTAR